MPDDVLPDALPIPEETVLEKGADITGVKLPSLSDPEEVPASPVKEGAVAPEVDADAGVIQPKPKRDFQSRINSLTRKRREAEEQNSVLSQQLNFVTQQLEDLRRQARQPVVQQPPLAPAGTPIDAFGGGEGQPPAPPAAPSAEEIAAIVLQQLNGYAQQQQQAQQKADTLRLQQEESFGEALEDIPDLADGRTQAGKLFNQLWAQSPLRNDPNGPFHVAMTVRGLLADGAGNGQPSRATETQKLQAATFAPKPSTTDVPEIGRQQLEQAYAKAMQAYSQGDKAAYAAARKIRGEINKLNR